jgi:hypothetical protein
MALPRGLRQFNTINDLDKSGTLNRSTASLGFIRDCPTDWGEEYHYRFACFADPMLAHLDTKPTRTARRRCMPLDTYRSSVTTLNLMKPISWCAASSCNFLKHESPPHSIRQTPENQIQLATAPSKSNESFPRGEGLCGNPLTAITSLT